MARTRAPVDPVIDRKQLWGVLHTAYPSVDVERWFSGQVAIHLALMRQPYFDAVLDWTKTIESRFARTRVAPIGQVSAEDLIIFKLVGHNRFAAGVVDDVVSGPLDTAAWQLIRTRAKQIAIDETYLATKAASRYFTLLSLRDVHAIGPITVAKRDRRGWAIVSPRERQPVLL